jgi:hypothetical protein
MTAPHKSHLLTDYRIMYSLRNAYAAGSTMVKMLPCPCSLRTVR